MSTNVQIFSNGYEYDVNLITKTHLILLSLNIRSIKSEKCNSNLDDFFISNTSERRNIQETFRIIQIIF